MDSLISRQDSLPLSDASSSSTTTTAPGGGGFNSDEDRSLAINRPKKKAGRKIFKETRHPIYRGVRKRNGNKWVCELREPNKKTRIWLGTYPTLEMAARAHDVAALALRGKSACLNFADSAWKLPVPASADSLEIRRAAGEAAELFRPKEFGGCYRSEIEECSSEDKSEELVYNCLNYEENESVMFIDEEEIFGMPRLLADMAEGLLLSPPYVHWNCPENDYNVSLWS
ncbi:dehydration-responsive element-binding protein 1B-like [Euphorbia lathyris]|uniref:dehydration-responsive element-binding protein 1B-like n=1 Tax=Euphorbia lathyris TaxID=212925 RepID=UPI0033136AFB